MRVARLVAEGDSRGNSSSGQAQEQRERRVRSERAAGLDTPAVLSRWLLTHPPTVSMRSASCARVSGGCSTDCLLFMHLRNSAQRLAVVLKLKLNRLNAKSSSLEPHRCGPAFACSSAMTLSR